MKKGLVLEGGGSRGVFTSGVLDYLQEQGVTFDYCVGVSAGAGNAMNFKSGQTGRAFRSWGVRVALSPVVPTATRALMPSSSWKSMKRARAS